MLQDIHVGKLKLNVKYEKCLEDGNNDNYNSVILY